ncbi:hypothetical protein PCE1_001671 [Barthelona sp. PCE]
MHSISAHTGSKERKMQHRKGFEVHFPEQLHVLTDFCSTDLLKVLNSVARVSSIMDHKDQDTRVIETERFRRENGNVSVHDFVEDKRAEIREKTEHAAALRNEIMRTRSKIVKPFFNHSKCINTLQDTYYTLFGHYKTNIYRILHKISGSASVISRVSELESEQRSEYRRTAHKIENLVLTRCIEECRNDILSVNSKELLDIIKKKCNEVLTNDMLEAWIDDAGMSSLVMLVLGHSVTEQENNLRAILTKLEKDFGNVSVENVQKEERRIYSELAESVLLEIQETDPLNDKYGGNRERLFEALVDDIKMKTDRGRALDGQNSMERMLNEKKHQLHKTMEAIRSWMSYYQKVTPAITEGSESVEMQARHMEMACSNIKALFDEYSEDVASILENNALFDESYLHNVLEYQPITEEQSMQKILLNEEAVCGRLDAITVIKCMRKIAGKSLSKQVKKYNDLTLPTVIDVSEDLDGIDDNFTHIRQYFKSFIDSFTENKEKVDEVEKLRNDFIKKEGFQLVRNLNTE